VVQLKSAKSDGMAKVVKLYSTIPGLSSGDLQCYGMLVLVCEYWLAVF